MTYGLDLGLFAGSGPSLHSAQSIAPRRSSSYAWRKLDAERRLALVEKALAPAANDDSPDGYSLAL